MFDIVIDLNKFNEEMRFLGSNIITKSIKTATNRTLDSMASRANKAVRSQLKLKLKDVNATLVKRKMFAFGDDAYLKISNKPIPLIKYMAGANKHGKVVKVNIKGTKKAVKHGFVATMPTGHKGIFERKTKSRLPIREMFGPSVRDVFKDPAVVEDLISFGRDKFEKEFNYALNFYRGGF